MKGVQLTQKLPYALHRLHTWSIQVVSNLEVQFATHGKQLSVSVLADGDMDLYVQQKWTDEVGRLLSHGGGGGGGMLSHGARRLGYVVARSAMVRVLG